MVNSLPKTQNLYWTQHSRQKLHQYNLSESRIKRVLRFPKRQEVGVAPDTVAVMQPAGSKRHPYEIWVMYQRKRQIANSKSPIAKNRQNKITIISAWKYPGTSPIHEPPPIPEELWEVLSKRK